MGRLKSSSFLKRTIEVTTHEGSFELTYNGCGIGSESVLVNGVPILRVDSFLWFVPRFELTVGHRPAVLEVRVRPWLAIRSLWLTIDDEVVYAEGPRPVPAKTPYVANLERRIGQVFPVLFMVVFIGFLAAAALTFITIVALVVRGVIDRDSWRIDTGDHVAVWPGVDKARAEQTILLFRELSDPPGIRPGHFELWREGECVCVSPSVLDQETGDWLSYFPSEDIAAKISIEVFDGAPTCITLEGESSAPYARQPSIAGACQECGGSLDAWIP